MASAPDNATIDEAKRTLRASARARRDALPAAIRQAAAETVAAREFPFSVGASVVVSGFMPLGDEFNPLPLMTRCAAAGALLALPVVTGRGQPLVMRAWRPGEPLAAGVWGIRQPLPQAPEVAPDILLVPLLAFDRRGGRIGYGAGYYDRTIAKLRQTKPVKAVGVAFAAQEVAEVPVTAFDARLDLVLTERDVIVPEGD